MASVKQFMGDKDDAVHANFLNGKIPEAIEANNAMDAAKFVLELPEDFIRGIKRKEESEKPNVTS